MRLIRPVSLEELIWATVWFVANGHHRQLTRYRYGWTVRHSHGFTSYHTLPRLIVELANEYA